MTERKRPAGEKRPLKEDKAANRREYSQEQREWRELKVQNTQAPPDKPPKKR